MNSSTTKFGVGVIGATGYIGRPYRAELRESEQAQIVALCARREGPLRAAAEEDGAELATADWREVVNHPRVNLVLVATPDALHYETVMATAEAGKHLVCEKPVGNETSEAAQMWKAYQQAGLAHFVPFWTRFVPLMIRAREVVRSGRLGEIKAIVYRWHNPRPLSMPFTWRDDAQLSSSGSIADVGSHAYDAMRWILDQNVVRVIAQAEVLMPPKPALGEINLDEALRWCEAHSTGESPQQRKGTAFDYASIAMQWQSGAVGTLILSHASYLRKGIAPDLELHGTDASLLVDRAAYSLKLARDNGQIESLESITDPGPVNRFARYVLPALRASIDQQSTDHPDLEDGLEAQRFTDAAAASARQGRAVELAEIA